MRFRRLYTSILIAVLSIFIFTACGSTLEKPTGIEDTENKQIETKNDYELVDLDVDEKIEKSKKSDQTKKHEEEKSTVEKESNYNKETKITQKEKDSQRSNKPNDTKSNQEKNTKSKENSNQTKSSKSSNSNSDNSTSSKGTEKNQTTKSPEQKEKKQKETKSTVTQSIVISSDEVPLSATKTEINGEETVLDVLIKITKEKGIQMDYRGGGSTAYIEGIANVYEFDRGQGSGWMYRINGVFPDRGAGAINVQDGDVIEWLYTTDLGKDLGANLQPFRR
ncbi:DUF4430 domain-containing protein [Pseudogracilibacillus sp. SE30717A]|uniref:DUF4430 domain-containing protein n=1 Tax=Pseudogracilibacillus sp. SE30717A TaxID=3098293 RepID=UPI00300E3AB3